MDNIPKIECQTEEVIKNKKTGKTYKTMEDFLKEMLKKIYKKIYLLR